MRERRWPLKVGRTACRQFLPRSIRLLANVEAVVQFATPTQRAAMLHIDQVRPAAGTGARSSLISELEARGEAEDARGVRDMRPGILPSGARESRAAAPKKIQNVRPRWHGACV